MPQTTGMPLDIDTPTGPARVTLTRPARSRGLLLLGHGAGGGIETPDLRTITAALLDVHVAVGLVEQPYRVAGRRMAAPAAALDAAMEAIVAAVRRADEPLVLGGRSSGARVACRTAAGCSAAGVLALAFPLRPPWRPEKSRLPELAEAGVPVLVVQGERDRFGSPAQVAQELAAHAAEHDRPKPDRGVRLLPVPGADHTLAKPLDLAAIQAWVEARLDERRGTG